MSGGNGSPAPARPRGRPKGSTNKRSKDLAGYVSARFGGSAAQQMAAACMVTPAEVRQAGGVLKARVEKARELADALSIDLAEAFAILSRELQALAPYTDQRQPLAIEASGAGFQPAVVFMGAGPAQHQVEQGTTDIAGEFRVLGPEVSQSKSHAEGQALDDADLFGAPASAGK